MLLSSEHLLSVSIKNRSSAGERKSRYSEEKKKEEKKREEKKRGEKKREEKRRKETRREETCPVNYGKFSYLEMQYFLNGIQ